MSARPRRRRCPTDFQVWPPVMRETERGPRKSPAAAASAEAPRGRSPHPALHQLAVLVVSICRRAVSHTSGSVAAKSSLTASGFAPAAGRSRSPAFRRFGVRSFCRACSRVRARCDNLLLGRLADVLEHRTAASPGRNASGGSDTGSIFQSACAETPAPRLQRLALVADCDRRRG